MPKLWPPIQRYVHRALSNSSRRSGDVACFGSSEAERLRGKIWLRITPGKEADGALQPGNELSISREFDVQQLIVVP